MPSTLSTTDRMILDMEARAYRYPGRKEADIRDLLSMSPTHYYQRLNALLDNESALAHAPMMVNRLRARRVSHGARRRSLA